jgi:hypothetical protein
MVQAYAVFSHGRFVWMLQTDVPVVLLDPGFNGMASLLNIDLTTFAGYAVYASSLKSQAIFHRPTESGNLTWWEAHRLDVVPEQHPSDMTKGHANKGKKGN